ncbi:MAG: acylneuraminate cytidylyltransferase family protein [Holosporales bacterium]|jgi:CMP-N,N'-diacetyllegionaminic acid synthase|nr:acylneuraminate cytidylyltransferase family protein [Holosporales bacterium]
MNLLSTICARAGSKGLKGKNTSDFLGKPLCYWTLAVYDYFVKQHPEHNCRLALNTDSQLLLEQVKGYGIPFEFIERTQELAGDLIAKIDVLKDTLCKVGLGYDLLVDLDLTSPLRTAEDIHGVIKTAVENEKADGAFSVTTARRSPFFNQVQKTSDGFYRPVIASHLVARQQAPEVFDMNASIYVFKASFLTKNIKSMFDGNMLAYVMEDTAVLDIDSQHDKDLMEIIAKHWWNRHNR